MYASRRRALLTIRRSPRRAEITARAKSHLIQRSNPNSWLRLLPWRLTERSAGILPAGRAHPARTSLKKVAFARPFLCLRFVRTASGSDRIEHRLACSIPSLSLRVLIQVRSIENPRCDLDQARNDIE